MSLVLYSYWRSSAAYRVRIALNVLGLDHEIRPVHLVRDGGEQHRPDYRELNPQGLVPTLVDGDLILTQSLTILEYLADKHPSPALLPSDSVGRARARQIAALMMKEGRVGLLVMDLDLVEPEVEVVGDVLEEAEPRPARPTKH